MRLREYDTASQLCRFCSTRKGSASLKSPKAIKSLPKYETTQFLKIPFSFLYFQQRSGCWPSIWHHCWNCLTEPCLICCCSLFLFPRAALCQSETFSVLPAFIHPCHKSCICFELGLPFGSNLPVSCYCPWWRETDTVASRTYNGLIGALLCAAGVGGKLKVKEARLLNGSRFPFPNYCILYVCKMQLSFLSF